MNAKKEKKARKLYRIICKRNEITPSQDGWHRYRQTLKNEGLFEKFLSQSMQINQK